MQPIAVPHGVDGLSNNNLRLGVGLAYALHALGQGKLLLTRHCVSGPLAGAPCGIRHRAGAHTQPLSSRSTTVQITSMPGSLSLRQGMCTKFSPPFFLKMWAFSTAISSSVSRQSAAKPGVTTARFLTPCLARLFTVASV